MMSLDKQVNKRIGLVYNYALQNGFENWGRRGVLISRCNRWKNTAYPRNLYMIIHRLDM